MKKVFIVFYSSLFFSCHNGGAKENVEPVIEPAATVTVTKGSSDPMVDYLELNATSIFLRQSYVKASASGYVTAVNAQLANSVGRSQVLFTIKTKEAESIGNSINLLDSSFRFSGIISIRAGRDGYVGEVDHQVGDYVQEGEQLAVINEKESFAFVLNLPYELRSIVLNRKKMLLELPDKTVLPASIASVVPVVDSATQTQKIILKVSDTQLPINLIAKVKVERESRPHPFSLPKQAVISNEAQTEFWVMKISDSTRAIKVIVNKGLEANDRIEILSPAFLATDQFILTGNIGLSDTARIKIVEH